MMMRWLSRLLAVLLLQWLCSGAAGACTMSLGAVTASPNPVAVGATVTVSIPISYAHCKGGAIQLGDDAPAGLSYAGCSSSAEWDCDNVYASGGATFSVYVPGNNGNKSATLSFSYTATSAGNRSITFTEYQTQTTSTVNITVGGSPPTVTTNAATAITNAGATLNGSVSSNGSATTVSFDYGTTLAYGSNIAATPSPLASGASNSAVSANLGSLFCGTQYHFRVRAVNSAGTSLGSNATFTTASCGSIADYRMDEASWNGSAGEVKDASGNGYHAQSLLANTSANVATTASTSPAYTAGAQSTCSYGLFDRSSAPAATYTYLGLPSSFPALSSSFTVTAWIRSSNAGQSGQRVIVNDDADNGWAISLGDAGSGQLRVFSRRVSPTGSVSGSGSNNACGSVFCLDTPNVVASNTWYFIAATVDTVGKRISSSVYSSAGALLANASSAFTGSWSMGSGAVSIGGEGIASSEGRSSSFHFMGNIDELQVFSGLLSASAIDQQRTRVRSCPAIGVASFSIAGTGSASTCTPQTLTITARDANGNTLTSYTGTVNLSTSIGRGNWSAGVGPAPAGTLTPGAANSGLASYTFAPGDAGVVRLMLQHGLAQDLTVTVVDNALPASASSSASIQYRDTVFVWSEDLANKIAGSQVVVAGRNHDLQVALWKKDAVSGNCAIASDYTGARNLKLWRTDNGGPWTAPGIVSPALASVPASRPVANNLIGLNFNAGVASLMMSSSDVGKFSFTLEDDSRDYAANTISANSGDLTLRPFALVISGIAMGATNNPNGSAASDALFGKAGANFSATVGAYRWSAGADANGDGVPDGGATLAQVSAGGLAPSFNTPLTLSPLAGSQTPASGVLGGLNNGSFSGFSGGSKTVGSLQYTEVGSFQLATAALVSNYLGSGQNLDALVFNSAGVQNKVVGRFSPANFTLTQDALTLRSVLACTPASSFNYLGENFEQALTLTARNVQGAITQNYDGAFARLDPSSSGAWNLRGIAGSTRFLSSGTPTRLSLTSSGSWDHGVSKDLKVTIAALRSSAGPDGPFENANALQLGIAPSDLDGVTMASFNLDTDSPADGVNDRSLIATVPLRFGRLRLQNAIGSQHRDLVMALQAEYWNGSAFSINSADGCTGIAAAHLNFGNYRKTLIAADAQLKTSPVQLASGRARLILAAPAAGHSGSYDLSIKLGNADASCLAPWAPNPAAASSANLAYLQGGWCTGGASHDKDPSARASFGLYGSSPNLIYQRENY
ncbi:DUF6701 domain-containing protein [Paucibacter soli]|uniref:DUF6701 domain-containing protein n=1 Tax=Paucibacter soli TaxID=3133433 RepID=UPI00309FA1E6